MPGPYQVLLKAILCLAITKIVLDCVLVPVDHPVHEPSLRFFFVLPNQFGRRLRSDGKTHPPEMSRIPVIELLHGNLIVVEIVFRSLL